jgi:hypothetical protein
MGMGFRDTFSRISREASKRVNPCVGEEESILLQDSVRKCSKFRGLVQDRWCVLTEERLYFFESFWASKNSKPTEAVDMSRVIGVQLTRNCAGLCVLNVICRSRLFGGRIIQFSLTDEGAATAWARCFAKMENVAFSSSVFEEKKPAATGDAGMTTGLSHLDILEHAMQFDEPKHYSLKRVNARALLCNARMSKCSESDSESDIASAEFVEVGGYSDPLRSMPYGENLCCADLCSFYQKMVANGEIRHRPENLASDEAEQSKSWLGHNSVSSTTVNEEFPSFETESTNSWD